MRWQFLANPTRFLRFSAYLMAPLAVGAIITLSIGLYGALVQAPADYQQGDAVRIMYIHVPSAYMATMLYAIMAVSCFIFLIFKHILADILARAIAPIGFIFTLLCIITGALWGQPIWGTWWVWDARLTSVLVLLFLYGGFLAVAYGFDNVDRGSKPAAILALLGALNLPIIKFSVEWWATLHQPASLLRADGVAIDSSMLTPLLWMLAAFSFIGALLVVRYARALTMQRLMANII